MCIALEIRLFFRSQTRKKLRQFSDNVRKGWLENAVMASFNTTVSGGKWPKCLSEKKQLWRNLWTCSKLAEKSNLHLAKLLQVYMLLQNLKLRLVWAEWGSEIFVLVPGADRIRSQKNKTQSASSGQQRHVVMLLFRHPVVRWKKTRHPLLVWMVNIIYSAIGRYLFSYFPGTRCVVVSKYFITLWSTDADEE